MPGRPDLVTLTPQGLYCPRGDFHIDPWRPVDRALITHAHADHARRGSRHYHARGLGRRLPAPRLGSEALIEGHPFGQRLRSATRWSRSIRPATCWAPPRSGSRRAARSG